MLSFKWGYLDGDLGSWSNDDVRAILLDLYPRKVALGPHEDAEVIAGFASCSSLPTRTCSKPAGLTVSPEPSRQPDPPLLQ